MSQEFTDYLSNLLGRAVTREGLVTLTSGQQARAAGWLSERGLAPPDLRVRLGTPFMPGALFDSDAGAVAPSPAGPKLDIGPASQAVGIDIQRIDELIPADALPDPKSSPELTAIFTLREISYAQSRPRPLETLGGLFAAKEALRKCDAALLEREFADVEVLPDAAGRPAFPGFALSIAHSGGFAVAVAVRAAEVEKSAVVAEVTPTVTMVQAPVAPKRDTLGVAFKVVTLLGALIAFALALERLGVLGGR